MRHVEDAATGTDWQLQSINPEDLTPTDLREEAKAAEAESEEFLPYRLFNPQSAELAFMLWLPQAGRAGIAHGADARWTDATSPEQAVQRWLDDAMIE